MVNQKYIVSWDNQALDQFREIFLQIRDDSYDNAQMIRQKINEITEGLSRMPMRYNPDKLRLDKNPNFRALEIYKVRISFYVDEQRGTVIIIRLRSTKRKPFLH